MFSIIRSWVDGLNKSRKAQACAGAAVVGTVAFALRVILYGTGNIQAGGQLPDAAMWLDFIKWTAGIYVAGNGVQYVAEAIGPKDGGAAKEE